jgi:hypothetical protein
MSRASDSSIFKTGMLVYLFILRGFRIQRIRFFGLFSRVSAILRRLAKPLSGGPIRPMASLMPGIVWQAGQPNRLIASIPRRGSPPVFSAADLSAGVRQAISHNTTVSSASRIHRGKAAERTGSWGSVALLLKEDAGPSTADISLPGIRPGDRIPQARAVFTKRRFSARQICPPPSGSTLL